jgi:hypothetical protein
MPPQQSDRLLDLFDDAFNFRAHDNSGYGKRRDSMDARM